MCVATRLCVGHSGIGLSLSTHINILVFAVIYPSQIIRKKKDEGKTQFIYDWTILIAAIKSEASSWSTKAAVHQ